MKKNMIYYFSGTGNSLQVANDLQQKLSDCSVNKIAEYKGTLIETESIGIIFPVYMCGLPLIVVDFLKNMKVSKNAYIFAVATYAGLSGKALEQVQKILEKNGLKLNIGIVINMPRNYIIEYGAISEKKQNRMFEKEIIKVDKISKIVEMREDAKIEKSKIFIDRLLADLMYKGINDLPEADKNYYSTDDCIGCGLCAKKCPVGNITMEDSKPRWNHNCQACVACIQYCPKEAIQYGTKTIHRRRYTNPNV